ncbi:hypothetical protein ABID56_002629 [Alkalibacillus flavidus]|uniref:Uncharacterized protein n=1 Tax=Alkalibacillus flavidus TaxID=546021 RepID=A0ABV2L106_9BACI
MKRRLCLYFVSMLWYLILSSFQGT